MADLVQVVMCLCEILDNHEISYQMPETAFECTIFLEVAIDLLRERGIL